MRGEIGGVFVMTEYSTLEVCNLPPPTPCLDLLDPCKIQDSQKIPYHNTNKYADLGFFRNLPFFPRPNRSKIGKNQELLPTPHPPPPHPEAAKPQNTAE